MHKYVTVIEALTKRKGGMTRVEIAAETGMNDGGASLTVVLSELEQCGFIRSYTGFGKSKYGLIYQLMDPFILFCSYVRGNKEMLSWSAFTGSTRYNAWCGLAFERVCLMHTKQMKQALGISGVDTREFAWMSARSVPGTQIDLLIDRRDRVVNLCEMKYSVNAYRLDAQSEKDLLNKKECFLSETVCEKSIHLTMVTVNGLAENEYSGVVQDCLEAKDLFG